MSIQMTPTIGGDGKTLTADQKKISQLEAELKETNSELKKALSEIEAIKKTLGKIVADKKRGPRF